MISIKNNKINNLNIPVTRNDDPKDEDEVNLIETEPAGWQLIDFQNSIDWTA